MENIFGSYIKEARERSGFSLSGAAELIGCTKSHLWEMEQGTAPNPTIKTLAGVATTYAIDLGELAEISAASCPGTAFRFAASNVVAARHKFDAVKANPDWDGLSKCSKCGRSHSPSAPCAS